MYSFVPVSVPVSVPASVPVPASASAFVEEDVLRTSVMCLKNSDLNFQSSLSFKKEICTKKKEKKVSTRT